jgi:hypothetical protein
MVVRELPSDPLNSGWTFTTCWQQLASSPPSTHGDDHIHWKSVRGHPLNTLPEFPDVDILLVDSAMRAAPTESIGIEISENLNFVKQSTLHTDASPSTNVSAARPVAGNFITITYAKDHDVVEEEDPQYTNLS